jgi:hypothetical protein
MPADIDRLTMSEITLLLEVPGPMGDDSKRQPRGSVQHNTIEEALAFVKEIRARPAFYRLLESPEYRRWHSSS